MKLSIYRSNLKAIHEMKLNPQQPNINSNISPEFNNSDNYCAPCNCTYKHRKAFRSHCNRIHNMKSLRKARKVEFPDLNDPKNYCKVCNVTYKNKVSYRRHCKIVHLMKFTKVFANPDVVPNFSQFLAVFQSKIHHHLDSGT